MKMKVLNYQNRQKQVKSNQTGNNYSQSSRRIKSLEKIYNNPKGFLREPLEVIEISVQENLEKLFDDYNKWRRGQAKRPEYIFNMTQDFAFVSILPKVVKTNYDFILENGEEFSEIISTAVGELKRFRRNKHADMIAIYSSIYEDLNERRIEKIVRLEMDDIGWEQALQLCLVSHGSPSFTVVNALRAMYGILKTYDYDSVHKLLRKLYGKSDMGKVAVYILLERKPEFIKPGSQVQELYSLLTNIALDEINVRSKDEVRQLLKLYCNERRKSEFDKFQRRRVDFSKISKEDYKKIHKVIKKLAKKNEMYRSFLDRPSKEDKKREKQRNKRKY